MDDLTGYDSLVHSKLNEIVGIGEDLLRRHQLLDDLFADPRLDALRAVAAEALFAVITWEEWNVESPEMW